MNDKLLHLRRMLVEDVANGRAARGLARTVAIAAALATLCIVDFGSPAEARVAARVHGGGRHLHRPAHFPVHRPSSVHRPVHRPAHYPIHRRGVVVAPIRPLPRVRPWYWGSVVAGVTVGTIIAATAAGVAPVAPSSELCWYWTDASQTRGYWDYCVAPTR